MWPGPWGEAMREVSDAFTAETGIPIIFDERVDGVMSTLVQVAQVQHRQPPIDVFYTFDLFGLRNTARGMFESFTPAEVPNIRYLLPQARPDEAIDEHWTYVKVGADVMTLVYRADKFPDGPPHSFDVLLEPRFKGRILLYSTPQQIVGLVGMMTGLKIPEEMPAVWQYADDRLRTQQPIIGGDPEVVSGFQRDEIDVTVSYPTIAHQLAPWGIRETVTREGMLGGDEAVGVPKGLPEANRYWAYRFVDFLLSREVLSRYCSRLLIACYRGDLTLDGAALSDPAIPKTPEEFARIHTVAPAVYAKFQGVWAARFNEVMK